MEDSNPYVELPADSVADALEHDADELLQPHIEAVRDLHDRMKSLEGKKQALLQERRALVTEWHQQVAVWRRDYTAVKAKLDQPSTPVQDEGIQRRRAQAQGHCRRRIELFKEEANG